MQKSHDIGCRDSRMNGTELLFLAGASVIDLHRFHFLTAMVFVPLEGVMVVVSNLDDFADLLLHAGKGLELAAVGESLGSGS